MAAPRAHCRALAIALVALVATSARADGGYAVGRRVVSGGGGSSAGGGFALSGSIGQADAGTASGGGYDLIGGSWPRGQGCVACGPEVCDDCADDDRNGLADRLDPACAPLADGAGAGVGAERSRATIACQKALARGGLARARDVQRRLARCALAVFTCIQTKPGDAACRARARTTCAKQTAPLAAGASSFAADVVAACGDVTLDELRAGAGFGFAAEAQTCLEAGVGGVDSAAAIAACVAAAHGCQAMQGLATIVPRARELLVQGGVAPGLISCVDPGADGGGAGLAAPTGKAVVKCQQAIVTAGTAVTATSLKQLQRCTAALVGCVHAKPGDAKCGVRALRTCAASAAPVLADEIPNFDAFVAKLTRACALPAAVLRDANGLGFAAADLACARVRVPGPAAVTHLVQCFTRHAVCRVRQMLRMETPRSRELLAIGGVAEP